jgi:hypothetical protein
MTALAFDGKEGVVGSSPTEGFVRNPRSGGVSYFWEGARARVLAALGVRPSTIIWGRPGKRIKTTHDTKRDACVTRATRACGGPAPSRERFEDCAERWLVEYRGRTASGLAPSTKTYIHARETPRFDDLDP